jgi:hypothetical protein
MNIVKKYSFALSVLFAFSFSASVAECIIPQPYRIGGTVTVDGSQLTQASDSGYAFVVTRQNGNDFNPGALDMDGLNGSNWYVIDIPIYDPTDQPGGANPGDTAVIHVYRNDEELIVTSPTNGSITVGNAGTTQRIDLTLETPYIPPPQYQLTASVSGGHGSVSPTSGTYDEGTVVTLTATPNSGYRVASWSGTNNDGSDSNTNTVTMNSNKTVTVTFEEIPSTQYTLTASVSGGHGSVSPTSDTYNEGTVVTLMATPNKGYQVASWSGTDNDSSDSNTNSVTMDAEKNVVVTFIKSAPVIERFTSAPGAISQGESTTLSWSIVGADSATIDNGIGSVDTSEGSINVSPNETTIYTLTAANSGGTVMASVSVTIEESSTEEDDHDNDGIPDSEDLDDDNDGLSDLWEQTYGLDPLDSTGVNGWNGDFDGDGWSNQQEYENETDPSDSTSVPSLSLIQIAESIPKNLSGVNDDHRAPNDTPFSVRIEAFNGIDITNTNSIQFTVDDGGIADYKRDLSNTQVVRVVKLTEEPDTNVGHLWVTYYKSSEPSSYPYNTYPFETSITIQVDVVDREGFHMEQAVFTIGIETEAEHEVAQESADLPDVSTIDPEDPDLEGEYDAGIQVDSGDLAGARIIYNSDEPLEPTFDFSSGIPPLDMETMNGVGIPLVLQPHAVVFSTPVRIFIPCRGYSDLSDLCVMFYNGEEWIEACDKNGEILPGGEGWMVAGSRVNHNNGNPSTIEIQVYHFSAVQAAGDATTQSSIEDSGAGCFIGAIPSGFDGRTGILPLFLMSVLTAVAYRLAARRRK